MPPSETPTPTAVYKRAHYAAIQMLISMYPFTPNLHAVSNQSLPYYFPALLHMEPPLQRIENYENKRRARRTPRNSNPTATVQSLQAILSPNRHPLSPECFLRAIGMYG